MTLTGTERLLVTGVSATGALSSVQESVSTQDVANLFSPVVAGFPRVISGTTGALTTADNGLGVQCTNAGAVTLTVPAGLGAFSCFVIQVGTGTVTPTASGTTIHNSQSHTGTSAQYAIISLIATAVNTFVMGGDAA